MGKDHTAGYRGTSLMRKRPPPEPTQGPTHRPTAGSQGVAVSYERGTPVHGDRVGSHVTANTVEIVLNKNANENVNKISLRVRAGAVPDSIWLGLSRALIISLGLCHHRTLSHALTHSHTLFLSCSRARAHPLSLSFSLSFSLFLTGSRETAVSLRCGQDPIPHNAFQLNDFRKSTPPPIVNLLFTITDQNDKSTILWEG